MSELVVEPFTNEFGQVINPGDEVIFAGTSWKNTRIRKGVFAGVRYANVHRYRPAVDANGNPVMEERYGRQYQKNEMYTERAIVAVRVEQVNRGFKYESGYDENGKYFYKKTDEIQYGVSTLPLKRVYRVDTSMAALAGTYF